MTALIADSWPACSCRGGCPQMLEHTDKGCSVLPSILFAAITDDRPLTAEELEALEQAEQLRRHRGYTGPELAVVTAADVPSLREALLRVLRHTDGAHHPKGTPTMLDPDAWDSLYRAARELLETHRLPGPEAAGSIGPAFAKLEACVALIGRYCGPYPEGPSRADRAINGLRGAADALEAVPESMRRRAPGLLFGSPVSARELRAEADHIEQVAQAVWEATTR